MQFNPATSEEIKEAANWHVKHNCKLVISLRSRFEAMRWGKIVEISSIKRKPTIREDGVYVCWRGDMVRVKGTKIQCDGCRDQIMFEIN